MTVGGQAVDIGALELLLSVASTGSIGRAAAQHGVSQPTASARLATFERRIGLPLLQRTPSGSRLTDDGALVAEWARPVVDAAASLDAAITALRGQHRGRLRVAASMTIAEYLLPGWLTAFATVAATTSVALETGNSVQVAEAVRTGRADLGFVEGPDLPHLLDHRDIDRDELCLVVAPGHPLARRRRGIDLAELAATALISREEGSGTRATLWQALPPELAAGAAQPLMELSSTTAIKSAVIAGLGPAVLSSLTVAADLAAGTLVRVPVATVDLRRRLRAVWPAGQRLAGPARDLVAIATRRAQRVAAGRAGRTYAGK